MCYNDRVLARIARTAAFATLFAGLAASCSVSAVDFTGKACPNGTCPTGFVCAAGRCQDKNVGPTSADAGPTAIADAAEGAPPKSTYASVVLADAPVGYWRFGDGAGSIARDEMGNAHPGTLSGDCRLGASGLVGEADTALALGPSMCRVELGDAFMFEGRRPFSIEIWLQVRNPQRANSARFLIERDSLGGPNEGYRLYYLSPGNGGLIFARWAGLGGIEEDYATAPNGFPGGVPVHVVGTFDGSVPHLYLNGSDQGGSAGSGDRRIPPGPGALAFGDEPRGGGNPNVDTVFDEIAIYDKALAAERVLAHYRAGGGR